MKFKPGAKVRWRIEGKDFEAVLTNRDSYQYDWCVDYKDDDGSWCHSFAYEYELVATPGLFDI